MKLRISAAFVGVGLVLGFIFLQLQTARTTEKGQEVVDGKRIETTFEEFKVNALNLNYLKYASGPDDSGTYYLAPAFCDPIESLMLQSLGDRRQALTNSEDGRPWLARKIHLIFGLQFSVEQYPEFFQPAIDGMKAQRDEWLKDQQISYADYNVWGPNRTPSSHRVAFAKYIKDHQADVEEEWLNRIAKDWRFWQPFADYFEASRGKTLFVRKDPDLLISAQIPLGLTCKDCREGFERLHEELGLNSSARVAP